MTRQRYLGLRGALYAKLKAQFDHEGTMRMTRAQYNARPDFTSLKSYADAWERLKPARKLVGM